MHIFVCQKSNFNNNKAIAFLEIGEQIGEKRVLGPP